jgi:hypothetical protein
VGADRRHDRARHAFDRRSGLPRRPRPGPLAAASPAGRRPGRGPAAAAAAVTRTAAEIRAHLEGATDDAFAIAAGDVPAHPQPDQAIP